MNVNKKLKIFKRDKFVCYICNKKLTRQTATVDHVIPKCLGGSNNYSNLKTCCKKCNSDKSNMVKVDKYYKKIKIQEEILAKYNSLNGKDFNECA